MAEAIATGAAANISSEAAKGIYQETKRHIRYVFFYQKYVAEFGKRLEILMAKRTSVQQVVDSADSKGEKIKADVELWRTTVDKAIIEEEEKVNNLQDKANNKCFFGLCPNIKSRYQLSRKAEQGTAAVEELIRQCQFNVVGYRDTPEAPKRAPPQNFKAFDSRKEAFDGVMEALKDSSTGMIGVYGTGGVGKTTLVNQVSVQVQKDNLFQWVAKATVTQTPNIEKIQDEIAESLKVKLEDKTKEARARVLVERFEKEKNVLVVLDDVWERLDLEKVGIPVGDQHKGCKLLLTSRNRDVLLTSDIDAKNTFAIHVLKEEEAWKLFKEMAEIDFEDAASQSVAMKVAKKCEGLPVAIVTVARALKSKDIYAWRDALLKLQKPSPSNFTDIPKAVYSAIELSYNYLESDELKHTFLLCCLLGHHAPVEDLVIYGMGLRLFENVDTLQQVRDRVLTLVSKLKAFCLLRDSYSHDRFDMHDFDCDVALTIASRDNHAFVLKHESVFEHWPDEERLRKFKMISLSFASVKEFPLELECPQLDFLRIESKDSNVEVPATFFEKKSKDSNVEVPAPFFEKMKSLKVLVLTAMKFSSISLPTSLRTLCLNQEEGRGDIANLVKLKNLEILRLSFGSRGRLPDLNDMKMQPEEIGYLTKLRLLDLRRCWGIIIPAGVLSCLSKLEELSIATSFIKWNKAGNAHLDELKNLSCLTALYICIPDVTMVTKDLFSEKLQRYKIVLGGNYHIWWDQLEYSRILKLNVNKSIDHLDCEVRRLLRKSEALVLSPISCTIGVNEVGNVEGFLHLKHLEISFCREMQYIMHDNDAIDKIVFPHLRSLSLKDLKKLVSFCATSTPQHELAIFGEQMEFPCLEDLHLESLNNVEGIWHNQSTAFPKLRTLRVNYCHKLRVVMPSSMSFKNLTTLEVDNCSGCINLTTCSTAKILVHLTSMTIYDCEMTEEIIACDCGEAKGSIVFTQLKYLRLRNLQNLASFSLRNHNFEFCALEQMIVEDCPKMEIFCQGDVTTPQLQKVISNEEVKEEQWEGDLKTTIKWMFEEGVGYNHLRLSYRSELIKTWRCYPSFKYLKDLQVDHCSNLRYLFTLSVALGLPQLRKMEVIKCNGMEHIIIDEGQDEQVANKIVFPLLESIYVESCPDLSSFYQGSKLLMEFPSLKMAMVSRCPQMFAFVYAFSREQGIELIDDGGCKRRLSMEVKTTAFFNNMVAFPVLNELYFLGMGESRKIWDDKINMKSFPALEKMIVHDCPKMEEIIAFNCDGVKRGIVFTQLKHLELTNLQTLASFSLGNHNFEFTALEKMIVANCPKMEEIIAFNCDGVKGDIIFTPLKHLELRNLQTLASFNLGNHNFEFVALEEMIVEGCPKMEIFCQGDVITPQLQKVIWDNYVEKERWEGDLKSTIKWMFEEGVGWNYLRLFDTSERIDMWKRNSIGPFKYLRRLEVNDCSTLRCLLTPSMALGLVILGEMEVINCSGMEYVITDEVADQQEENKVLFPLLEDITVESCPDLVSFYQGCKILEFPSLLNVKVADCRKMLEFASPFSREPKIEPTDDNGNSKKLSEDVSNTTFFNNLVAFPKLSSFEIEGMGELRKIWDDKINMNSFCELGWLTVKDCERLSNIFPYNMMQRLKKLLSLCIEKSASLEEIIGPKELNSNESHAVPATELILPEHAEHTHLSKEEIIACTSDEVMDDIIFSQLWYLKLSGLPSLSRFCSGNYTIGFPDLEKVIIRECPKMETFSKGEVSTPKLEGIKLTKDEYEDEYKDESKDEYEDEYEDGSKDEYEDESVGRWEGNLNATIQQLFIEKNVQICEEE